MAKNKQKEKDPLACRLNKVGGQAVLEGVMMKSGERYSLAVRKESGEIEIRNKIFKSIRKKYKPLNIPILRGIINFVEMMILSFRTLSDSVDMLGIEEEETKFEKWLEKHFGKKLLDFVMVISTVLGVVLGVGLFTFLPAVTTKAADNATGGNLGWFKNIIEGLIRIGIFVLYIWLVSFVKEIRRTFEYHGAEHKSIACYEAGLELTPENAKKCTRFHPRCGTSFIFVMLILSIIIFSFISWDNIFVRVGLKILLLPIVVGAGFEFIMAAGKHDSIIFKILSAPGLWMQRITTREPDESQLEVAIAALKSAMPDEFPAAVTEQHGENSESETAKEENK